MPEFAIRPAREQDAAAIRALLSELAWGQLLPGESLSKRFWLTEDDVRRDMLGSACHCDLLWLGEEAAGVAVWFWTYKSFRAARGLFVEDLYVKPARRGRGLGKALLAHLAARARGVQGFLEWQVLDRNAPAIAFYESLGAHPVPDWRNYRLEGEALLRLASSVADKERRAK